MRIPVILASVSLLAAGCSHMATRGTVAMKVSDEEAHVCLGNGEVKPGDKVALFANQCSYAGPGISGSGLYCNLVPSGEGEITRVLNEHYSVIRVAKGVPVAEGTVVEKVQ